MSNKWLWLTIGAVVVVAFVAGVVVGQAGIHLQASPPPVLKYPYLPAEYSKPFTPTLADWQALELTGPLGRDFFWGFYDGPKRISLIGQACIVRPLPDRLSVRVDADILGDWFIHPPDKRITPQQMEEVTQGPAKRLLQRVRSVFGEIADENIAIEFYLDGVHSCTWRGEKVTWVREERPAEDTGSP